ncbi:exonuclease subunit SbcD [Mucilaginibacter sp. HC2]|uniref:exonuclease SbcCD subunit D C-terminal domain-containing protein n=1 Tax=Mucilaginibacter inviolabilis TaxID=2714892 RepID=UPI00140A4EF6|nr:exonuclease SbcCD subunit D C-terminal domain-containing protein [Mucilaginibacter inviolabilis]NHA03460.1 exonuclease subunit SbcD [Mucilaginibacter inviolabilis]
MRVLHTADWHLGKRLEQFERTEEHQDFLDWLIGILNAEKIEVLIVAGDIFDSGSPSNSALEQYYRFLRQVKDTCCRDVVIIGGNHDSISTLNAPKTLLKYFNVHIVGGVPEHPAEQVIPIKNSDGEIGLIVCAVPFLRDKDIRLSISGETAEEREMRIKMGIMDHYHNLVEHIALHKEKDIPVIATGHLFAAGGAASGSEKDIHVGNLGQVAGDQFPMEFNYIALGHLHKPQKVNGAEHIRYSGSPIALDFSEYNHKKQVIAVEFRKGVVEVKEVPIPPSRSLIRISGSMSSVKSQISLLEDAGLKYPAWVELKIETDAFLPDLSEQLAKLKLSKPFIGHFFSRQQLIRRNNTDSKVEALALNDLTPEAVFGKKYESVYGSPVPEEMLSTFKEALEALHQQEGGS